MNTKAVQHSFDVLVGCLCEVIAWTLYGLSRVRLAPRPCYTSSIAECETCGYRMDRNGFPRFPLYRLAREFEAEIEQSRRLRSLAGNRVKCMACGHDIHSDHFAGVFRGDFYCDAIPCLLALSDRISNAEHEPPRKRKMKILGIVAILAVGSMLLFALYDNYGWMILSRSEIGQFGGAAMKTARARWASERGVVWGQCGRCGRTVIPGKDWSIWDSNIQRHVCRGCGANARGDSLPPERKP